MTDSRDRIARYVKMRAEKPIRGLDPDHVAGMHLGTEWEAEVRVSDLAALLAENERLTDCLKAANAQAEHFERQWYLRGDALEAAEARLRDLANAEPVAIVLDHDSYDHSGHRFMVIDWSEPMLPIGTRLIRRPEMPS